MLFVPCYIIFTVLQAQALSLCFATKDLGQTGSGLPSQALEDTLKDSSQGDCLQKLPFIL